jgi:Flp pilus assembly pilin Flp
VSQLVSNSARFSRSFSVISGRRFADGTRQRAKEVNSLRNFSQKMHARFVTTFSADEGQTMAEYGIVLALITLAVVATIGLLGGAVDAKLSKVYDVIKP